MNRAGRLRNWLLNNIVCKTIYIYIYIYIYIWVMQENLVLVDKPLQHTAQQIHILYQTHLQYSNQTNIYKSDIQRTAHRDIFL